MSDAMDYYDVQNMIRDARSEISREIRDAAAEVREQVWVELANLQREIDSLERSILSLHRTMDERTGHLV